MGKDALIVGGSSGIGLSIAYNLKNYDNIYIVDKNPPESSVEFDYEYYQFDLRNSDYTIFKKFRNINTLIITAGFGKLSLFKDLSEEEIINSFNVNTIAAVRIINIFYDRLIHDDDFYCAILTSITGMISSPLFSVYGATKAALVKFIESVNVELIMEGTTNRILNVSPGMIEGTNFYKKSNNLEKTTLLAQLIINKMYEKLDLFIPEYENIYKEVLERYHRDFREFGIQSYLYKMNNKRY